MSFFVPFVFWFDILISNHHKPHTYFVSHIGLSDRVGTRMMIITHFSVPFLWDDFFFVCARSIGCILYLYSPNVNQTKTKNWWCENAHYANTIVESDKKMLLLPWICRILDPHSQKFSLWFWFEQFLTNFILKRGEKGKVPLEISY